MQIGFLLLSICLLSWFFFFKQKTAYEMRISDWSSDVCSSDLVDMDGLKFTFFEEDIIRSRPAVDDPDDAAVQWSPTEWSVSVKILQLVKADGNPAWAGDQDKALGDRIGAFRHVRSFAIDAVHKGTSPFIDARDLWWPTLYDVERGRSDEHTSELQSLMRVSDAVVCL